MKRFLTSLLVCCLLLSFVPAHAAKSVASGSCGKNVTWRLDSDGVFTVSGTGEMHGYSTYSGDDTYHWIEAGEQEPSPLVPWYDHLGEIRAAVIEPGVTSVSHGAFTFCENLESVRLPESLTKINSSSFAGCAALREITIPDAVESIGYSAFQDCTSLQGIRLPAALRWIEPGAMSGCTSLQRLELSSENTHYRMVDGVLFTADGAELVQYPPTRKGAYVIPKGVKTYGAAFQGCVGLTKLTFSSPMEEYGGLENLPALKECVLPEGMTRIPSRFFAECTALERVTIPGTVTAIGGQAFIDCTALQSVQLPEGLTTLEEWAFCDCANLKHLNLPSTLTEIGELAFCRCESWCDKTVVPSGVHKLGKWAFLGCSSLTDLTLPDTLEEIGEWCFASHKGLTSLRLPDSIKTIGENAFYECENLRWIILPPKLTTISAWMFGNDKQLETIGIPRSVKQLGDYAFGGCWKLSDVYYEGTEAEWNQIRDEGRNGCLLYANIHFNSDLSRMPKPVMKTPVGGFRDVFSDDYYADAVLWAVQHEPQITNGTEPGVFSPGAACTRAQMVTFLWRAAGCPQPKDKTNPFRDVKSGDYFYQAVLWAVENGITAGTGANTFSPGARVTRAQTVTFLWRAAKSPAVAGSVPFQDVPTRQYYTDAVLWAVKKKITNGTDATHFSPDASCTRGQIVTFLYRAVKE